MDLTHAIEELRRVRDARSLSDLEVLVNQARTSMTQPDANAFMLDVCDLLASSDFGDYEGQPLLLSRYADETLASPGIELGQRLRLLAHLEHDLPVSSQDWPRLRDQRSQAWLHALTQADQQAGPRPAETPLISVPVPHSAQLPHGVPPEAITDGATRAEYQAAVDRNSELSRQVAQHHRMRQLLAEYQPRAMNYVARAYSQPPQDTARMRQLLDQIGSLAAS